MVLLKNIQQKLLTGLIIAQMLFLVACSNSASTTRSDSGLNEDTATTDQFEKLNRVVYKANVAFDKYLLKPAAKVYKSITPAPVDTSVTNFFLNLGDIGNAANNLLQFKIDEALLDTERFIFNSTFGIAGLFDVATEMGIKKHHEDFGQTLAVWGVDSGPYVMLPFFGPSTLRDATAKFSLDFLLDPKIYRDEKYSLIAMENLDKRANLLSAEDAFNDLSDDKYIAIRDAWLQRREYLIRDGKVDEKKQSDLIDELEDLDDN